jgi:hypothetical protein
MGWSFVLNLEEGVLQCIFAVDSFIRVDLKTFL